MLLTSNFGLKKPEATDPVDVQDFNDNADVIDTELKKRPESDGSATNMTVEFAAATQLTELTNKDSLKGLFGKLALAVKTVIDLAKNAITTSNIGKQSVKYAESAGSANSANSATTASSAATAEKAKCDGNGNEILYNYMRSSEFGGTIAELKAYTNGSPCFCGSGNFPDGPAGNQWYNVMYIPHRNGISGDSTAYGQLIMFPMTGAVGTVYIYTKQAGNWTEPQAYHAGDYLPLTASCNKNWNWQGLGGQPSWLWGGENGTDMYVYNPANFSVNYATYASKGLNNDFSCGYARMYHSDEGGNLQITSPNGSTYEMDAFENEYIRIYAGDSDKHLFRVYANGQFDTYYTLSDAGAFRPRGFDNTLKLGTSGNRWKQLYAGTASISTSDRNFKKEIRGLEEKHLNFFLRLIPVSYQFIDGESGRTHIGFIAQDVEDAMEQCGITALDFAGFCKDVKTQSVPIEKKVELLEGEIVTYTDYEERPVLDADGNPEYIYSLRYEEFIALVTYATQKLYKKVDEMEARMERMEDRLATLEK